MYTRKVFHSQCHVHHVNCRTEDEIIDTGTKLFQNINKSYLYSLCLYQTLPLDLSVSITNDVLLELEHNGVFFPIIFQYLHQSESIKQTLYTYILSGLGSNGTKKTQTQQQNTHKKNVLSLTHPPTSEFFSDF